MGAILVAEMRAADHAKEMDPHIVLALVAMDAVIHVPVGVIKLVQAALIQVEVVIMAVAITVLVDTRVLAHAEVHVKARVKINAITHALATVMVNAKKNALIHVMVTVETIAVVVWVHALAVVMINVVHA